MGFKTATPQFTTLDIEKLKTDADHPRRQFDEAGLKRLADSIARFGLIQPVLVQPADAEGFYRVIIGERRVRAARLAGETQLPALIRACDSAEALEAQVLENLGQGVRAPLTAREMAQALKRIARGFDSPEAAAEHFGQPATWLEQKTAPANLSPKVEALLESGAITSATTAVQLEKLAQKNEARLDELVAKLEEGEKLPKQALESALVAEGVKRARKPVVPMDDDGIPIAPAAAPEPVRAPEPARQFSEPRRSSPRADKVRTVAQILGLDTDDEEMVLDRLIDEFLAMKSDTAAPF